MKRKHRIVLTMAIALIAVFIFLMTRTSTPQYSGFSTTPDGVSLEFATPTTPYFYAVKIGNLYGYIDQDGNLVIPPRFTFAMTHFSNGVARVQTGSKYGYIDSSGDWVIQPQFDKAEDFTENLAAVGINGKYGFIDLSGAYVYPLQFDYAYPFYEGAAIVINYPFEGIRKAEQFLDARIVDFKYIDANGHFISKPIYRPKAPPQKTHDVYPFRQNDLWGLSTSEDVVIVPPTYRYIYNFHGPLAKFSNNGVDGYINHKGEVVWPKSP